MSGPTANEATKTPVDGINSILADIEPMGDLRQFTLEDLTAEEEAKFFAILKNA